MDGTSTASTLPSKIEYIATGMQPSAEKTCGICLDTEEDATDEHISLTPCGHVFCRICAILWFTTPPSGKCTCPSCRRVLFNNNSDLDFTDEQIRHFALLPPEPEPEPEAPQLRGPPGPHRPLGPDEVLMDWELYVSRKIAREAVELELHRISLPSQDVADWKAVCKRVAAKILMVEDGANILRTTFNAHRKRVILYWAAQAMVPYITRSAVNLAWWEYDRWDRWHRAFKFDDDVVALYQEALSNGLFQCTTVRVEVVSKDWLKEQREIERLSARNIADYEEDWGVEYLEEDSRPGPLQRLAAVFTG